MIIVGVDPGSYATGYGVLLIQNSQVHAREYGVIRAGKGKSLDERVEIMYDSLTSILSDWSPDVVSIETPFMGKNANTALVLGHVRGAILLAARKSAAQIAEFAPTTIKKAVVGNGRAEKSQLEYMLRALLKLPEEQIKDDAFDALGAAFCAFTHRSAIA